MEIAPGEQEALKLKEAGFDDHEVAEWRNEEKGKFKQAGFSDKEVSEHFGAIEPDMAPMREFINGNLQKLQAEKAATAGASNAAKSVLPEAPREAKDFWEAMEAGYQMSVVGLVARDKMPDTVMPEHAETAMRIGSGIGSFAGDLPAFLSGAISGSAAGGVAGGPVGAVLGAGAGSIAIPAAMREFLVQEYKKGTMKSFGDFWERSAGVFLEGFKGAVTGAATAGAGGIAAKAVAGVASPIVRAAAPTAAEIFAMTNVGKAMEGEVAGVNDYIDAAILVTGFKGLVASAGELTGPTKKVAGKLMDLYAKTGRNPKEVALEAENNPVLKGELLADNMDTPPSLDPDAARAGIEIKSEKHASMSEGFSDETLRVAKVEETVLEGVKAGEGGGVEEIHPIDKRIVSGAIKKPNITFGEIYRNAVDDLHYIKQLRDTLTGKEPVAPSKDPYVLARLTRGNYGRADHAIQFGPYDFHTLKDTGTPGLQKILSPFKGEVSKFERYMVARTAVELFEKRGTNIGVEIEGKDGARTVVEAGKEQYESSFREFVNYRNDMLKYLRDSGVISGETYTKSLEAREQYVPLKRKVDKATGLAKGHEVYNPIKKLGESDLQIISPVETTVKDTYLYTSIAERNRVLTSMVDLAQATPEGQLLVERVPTEMRPIRVDAKEMAKFLEEHGISAGDLSDEAMTIFRPAAERLAADEIAVYREGKREIYRVPPEIAETIKGLDADTIGLLTKILSVPAQTLRAGVTSSPDFMAANLVRDQATAFIRSPNGYIPIVDYFSGLGSLLKSKASTKINGVEPSEHFKNWLKGGGAQSVWASVDTQYIQNDIYALSKKTGLLDRGWNIVKTPIELASLAGELSELPTRIGEYKKSARGKTDPDSIFQGSFDARNVSLDFRRIGARARAVNSISAFFNPGVQGLDAIAQDFKTRPGTTTLKAMAAVTVPSLILYWANKGDPRIDELPDWVKDNYWPVPTDKWVATKPGIAAQYPEALRRQVGDNAWEINTGTVHKIPKPQQYGLVFGSVAERILDAYFKENPQSFKDFSNTLLDTLPNLAPNALVPGFEQWANRSVFRQTPIVPYHLEKMAPEYQYTAYTSETAKALGKIIGHVPGSLKMGRDNLTLASPLILENYIQAWTGTMGKYALQLGDKALSMAGVTPPLRRAEDTLADMVVVKAFAVRHPSMQAKSIQVFFEKMKVLETSMATVNGLAKQGDKENTMKEARIRMEDGTLLDLSSVKEAMGDIAHLSRMVDKDPNKTPAEKRQLIDGIYYSLIRMAQMTNKQLDLLHEKMEARKKSLGQ